ncbi:MAG TPA: hypothetical protein VJO32_07010 [Ktedonobacteraceae bacterium]|nr:hypothetical protein [Ktedonobacteraceae bacterium]
MLAHQGVYTGDTVALACYTRGSTVPPNNDPLWYWAEIVSGHGQGAGWVNNYFLNTGTNQPNIPVNNVIACPKYPYVWSNTGTANIRALPEDNSTILDPPSPANSTQIETFCWLDGAWASSDNYPTNRWFQVPIYYTSQAYHGYIHASLLANQHTTPHCDASIQNPVTPVSIVTLARGPAYSGNAYHYAITLSAFPKNATISVECYDSVSPSGFGNPFTMTTDGMGNGFEQNKCYSGDGPDHWVIAGSITSNHVQWGGGDNQNPPSANPTITLAQGPSVSSGVYRYVVSLSGFPANTSVSVECYDSVSPAGFFQFTMTTDSSGNASTQNECYSGDGPDHWVIAGGVTSNHVQWGGGSTNNPSTPTPIPTAPPPPIPTPSPTLTLTAPPAQPVDAYSNYGPANTGYPICRGNPNNSQSWPGGTVSQTFTVPTGVASLSSALVQIDPDSTVTAHMNLAVNGNVVATADAAAAGDTQFQFGPVSVSAGDVITLSISFTATYGKIITVYTAGSPAGTFTTSDSCPDGASNVSLTNTGLRARVSGMS